jgi:hypothetical protein
VREELIEPGWVSPHDTNLYTITDDVDEATSEILGFWRNYQGLRWVGGRLVLRLRADPTDAEIAALNEQFADLLTEGHIERTPPLAAEVSDNDRLELPRLLMRFDVRRGGRFRELIRALNALDSAPPADVVDYAPPGTSGSWSS